MKSQNSAKITRREFIKQSAALTASAIILPSALLSNEQNPPPKNVVFIISDQHRWDVTRCYGNQHIDTPNIDSLANEGVKFENMYCQFPLCAPSRQSIITSQYASKHSTRRNNVPQNQYTLVDYLNSTHEYNTWLSGKSHMSIEAFDIHIDTYNLINYLTPDIIQAINYADQWYDNQYNGLQGKATKKKINTLYALYPLIEDWHLESLFVKVTEEILMGHSERPTFFWISFKKPHPNWTPPEFYWNKYRYATLPTPKPATPDIINNLPSYLQQSYYNRKFDILTQQDITNSVRAYYACIEYMDHVVGLILDLLNQHNLVQDTIVIYTSDHGEMMGHNGMFSKNCFYEPAVHIPCIMRYPGMIPAGQVVDQITEQIDLMPTIFDFVRVPLWGREQGTSVS